ncbi:MAG: MBOAT family protein [Bacteroidota bacterium]
MVFSSLYFLLYFLPIFLLFYYASPKKAQNVVALLASCFFYAWGEPEFIIIIITSLILDFYLVQLIEVSRGLRKKRLLALTIILNVGLLVVAKYLNFFVDNINGIAQLFGGEGIRMARIALPIGISFITFQKISYVLDCHQGRSKPLQRFEDYALYILLFPQLIAGPIVRFNEIASQLQDRSAHEHIDDRLAGLFRFLIGLAKKVLIANSVGLVVDDIFSHAPDQLNTVTAWVGIIAYSFQIYFDFSGYSDMAIGLARMLGFRFPENFNFPYIAQNITEFWRRWHITLSNWMRDYLYIPLGGNRVSKRRLYFNLCAVFLISGLWHGAAWTFIFWGAFHGLFLILDRLFLVDWLKGLGKVPSVLITYLIVLLGWVFFRSPDFSYAFAYIGLLFSFSGNALLVVTGAKFWFFMLLAVTFSFMGVFNSVEQAGNRFFENELHLGWLSAKALFCALISTWSLLEIFASGFNPFIYFQF